MIRYLKFIEACDGQTYHSEYYYERHHIIPKSFGGDNSDDNIIKLTPRQHFVAHLILAREVPCRDTIMSVGAMSMAKDRRQLKSKEIEIARECASICRRGVKRPPHVGEAVRLASTGRKASLETRKKQSKSIRQFHIDNPNAAKENNAHLKGVKRPKEIVDKVANGIRLFHKNNPGAFSGENNSFYSKTLYVLQKDGVVVCDTRYYLEKDFGIGTGLYKVIKGERLGVGGYKPLFCPIKRQRLREYND